MLSIFALLDYLNRNSKLGATASPPCVQVLPDPHILPCLLFPCLCVICICFPFVQVCSKFATPTRWSDASTTLTAHHAISTPSCAYTGNRTEQYGGHFGLRNWMPLRHFELCNWVPLRQFELCNWVPLRHFELCNWMPLRHFELCNWMPLRHFELCNWMPLRHFE